MKEADNVVQAEPESNTAPRAISAEAGRPESSKAHAAAQEYFRLGSDRSLDALANRLQKSKRLLARWSVEHDWVRRAQQYDREIEQVLTLEAQKRAVEENQKWRERKTLAAEEGYQQAKRMDEKIDAMLKFPLADMTTQDGKTIVKPAKWSFASMGALARTSAQMKQRSFDMLGSGAEATKLRAAEANSEPPPFIVSGEEEPS